MKNPILSSLVFAALIVGAVFTLKYLAAHGLIAGDKTDLSQRILQVTVGLLVAWVANLAPKRLTPLDDQSCDPTSEQRGRRFGSMIIMIGGLLYSLAWLLAPASLAFPLSITAVGGSVAIVLLMCFASLARR